MQMFSEGLQQELHICSAGFSCHPCLRVAVIVQLVCHCPATQVNAYGTRALRLRSRGGKSEAIVFSSSHGAPTGGNSRLLPHRWWLWPAAKWKGASVEIW